MVRKSSEKRIDKKYRSNKFGTRVSRAEKKNDLRISEGSRKNEKNT